MNKLEIGDLVIGVQTWWGDKSFLDERFCNEPGVVSDLDIRSPERFVFVTFSFGTYLLQTDDLILISKKGAESLP